MMKYLALILFLLAPMAQAAEDSAYNFSWLDPDKKIYVLQNRKYRKKNRFSLSALGGFTTSSSFIESTVIQGRIGYFFSEAWGIELVYSFNDGEENDSAKAVRQDANAIPFYRQIESYYGGMLVWSPFYGKVNTFNKVVHFDWVVGLGAAIVNDEHNRNSILVNSDQSLTSESHTGPMGGTGLRFYLSQTFSIRLDLTGVYYSARTGSAQNKRYYSNYDVTLGINALF